MINSAHEEEVLRIAAERRERGAVAAQHGLPRKLPMPIVVAAPVLIAVLVRAADAPFEAPDFF